MLCSARTQACTSVSHVCSLGIVQNTRSSSRVGGIGVFALDLPTPLLWHKVNRESLSPLTLQCSRASRASSRALHHQINPAPTGVGISEDSAWRRAKACLPRVPGDRYIPTTTLWSTTAWRGRASRSPGSSARFARFSHPRGAPAPRARPSIWRQPGAPGGRAFCVTQ